MTTEKVNDIAHPVTVSKSELDYLVYPTVREEMLKANPSFRTIFENRRTRIRILILADGDIAFDDSKFGLSELIDKALRPSAMPWENLEIITAHRDSNERSANIPGFRFDKTPPPPYNRPFTAEFYDQLWLFGNDGAGSKNGIKDDSERKVIMDFMNAGGGVFATGDHKDLGAGLCYEVPRVRHMRKWLFRGEVPPEQKAPSSSDETRIDTLVEGFDPGFQFDDQSDTVPKRIYPKFKVFQAHKGHEPHPLLSYRHSAITILPDHMHEGECVVPKDLDKKTVTLDGVVYEEFPPLKAKKEERLAPDVVAVAISAGGYLTDDKSVFPSDPRCYNAIVAYDGTFVRAVENGKSVRKNVGRVVVNSSFHHFVNINLNGRGSGYPLKKGFYDSCGKPTKDYFAIKQYYRNLVTWLSPRDKRVDYYISLLLAARYMSPLIEEIQPIEKPTCRDLLFAGAATRNAIAERFSRAEATECMLAPFSLLSEEKRAILDTFINPWAPSQLFEEELTLLFNFEALSNLFFGYVMQVIAEILPQTTREASQALGELESKSKRLETFIAEGLEQRFDILIKIIQDSNKKLGKFSALLNARP